MASSTETTASSFGGGVSPPRYPPPGLPPAGLVLMDLPPGPSTSNLLARVPVLGGDGECLWLDQGLPLPLASIRSDLLLASSRCLPQEGTRQNHRPHTSSRFIYLHTPLGHRQPPPRPIPPLAPVRVATSWSEGTEVPEVGPYPKVLWAKAGEIDLPPEDPGNAIEASRALPLWTMSPNTWPLARSKTSTTSSAATGQTNLGPWIAKSGRQGS